jgi:pimeloyl-ACP methyl ester carboxylesterase
MAPLAVRLGQAFRVLVPDLPGFGRSAKPAHTLGLDELADAMDAWMDAEGLPRAAFVGNSFGCQVIVRLALRHAGRVLRAVLQGPTTDSDAPLAVQIARWLMAGFREPLSLYWVLAADRLDCGLRRGVETYLVAFHDRLKDSLPAVTVPVLVVRGDRDRIAPQRWAEEVTRFLPRARLVVLPGVAHTANYTAADALARAIAPFLWNGGELTEPPRDDVVP